MLQAELEMLNEEPSEHTEPEELQTSLLEKQVSKLQNELDMSSEAPEEDEERDEEVQHNTSRKPGRPRFRGNSATSRHFRLG